jgi:hypothetical protein
VTDHYRIFDAEVVSTGCGGVSVLSWCDRTTTTMKRELDFALNFAMSVLLLAGSIAVAQNTTTTATKKKPSAAASTAGASSTQSGITTSTQTTQADATSQASGTAPVAAQDQATATAKPKTMVSKDKRTIPVPQF